MVWVAECQTRLVQHVEAPASPSLRKHQEATKFDQNPETPRTTELTLKEAEGSRATGASQAAAGSLQEICWRVAFLLWLKDERVRELGPSDCGLDYLCR